MKIVVLTFFLLGNSLASLDETSKSISNEVVKAKLADVLKQFENGNKSILDELPNIIFDLIVSLIGNSDADPIALPDLEVDFEEGLITRVLRLTEGKVGGFSKISRGGDAEVNIFLLERRANVRLPIYFEELTMGYSYFTRFGLIRIDGRLTGSFQGITTILDIDVGLLDLSMTLNEFSLDAERFIFRFEGNPLSDWMFNIMMNIVAELAREPILSAIESVFSEILGAIFGAL